MLPGDWSAPVLMWVRIVFECGVPGSRFKSNLCASRQANPGKLLFTSWPILGIKNARAFVLAACLARVLLVVVCAVDSLGGRWRATGCYSTFDNTRPQSATRDRAGSDVNRPLMLFKHTFILRGCFFLFFSKSISQKFNTI